MMLAATLLFVALVVGNGIGLVRTVRKSRQQASPQPAPFWLLTKPAPLPPYEVRCPYGSSAGKVRPQHRAKVKHQNQRHDRNR